MAQTTSSPFFRSWWRKLGLAAITLAAVMAIVSVPTGILHDTVVHAVRVSGGELPKDVSFSTPAVVCAAYWFIWIAALLAALFMAILDVRHIRLEYTLEKQALLRESLGDGLAESLVRRDGKR